MASHAAGYEELCSLGCNAMKSGESQSFEASLDFKRLHGAMPQKIEFFKK